MWKLLFWLHTKYDSSNPNQQGYGLVTEASSMDASTEMLFDTFDSVTCKLRSEAEDMSDLTLLPCKKNAGFEDTGRVIKQLMSMSTMEFMVSLLSAGFSCTHNNAMCIHHIISLLEPSINLGSTIFIGELEPSLQL